MRIFVDYYSENWDLKRYPKLIEKGVNIGGWVLVLLLRVTGNTARQGKDSCVISSVNKRG